MPEQRQHILSTPFFQDPECWVLSLQLPLLADQPNPTELTRQWFLEYQKESMELIFSPLRFAASAVVR